MCEECWVRRIEDLCLPERVSHPQDTAKVRGVRDARAIGPLGHTILDLHDLPSSNAMEMSSNSIRLDIQAPDCQDLALHHIPGTCERLGEQGRDSLIQNLRQVAMRHIDSDLNLVLFVGQDQGETFDPATLKLIDRAGHRAIGLLARVELSEADALGSKTSSAPGSTNPRYGYRITEIPDSGHLSEEGLDGTPEGGRQEAVLDSRARRESASPIDTTQLDIAGLGARLSRMLAIYRNAQLWLDCDLP